MSVKVCAIVCVKPGREDDFIEAADLCIAASRREEGVLRYDLWRESEGKQRFIFDELYFDKMALQQHTSSDHFKAIGIAVRDLTTSPPEIIVSFPVDAEGS